MTMMTATKLTLNGRNVNVKSLEVDNVDATDYPDFSDAYISYAEWEGTTDELTDSELEQLTQENPDIVNELAYDSYY
jgi:hypothetical protein